MTVAANVSMNHPHKVPADKCKGSIRDGVSEDGWVYWHGAGHPSWWHVKPLDGVTYLTCYDHIIQNGKSGFSVDKEEYEQFVKSYGAAPKYL